MLLPVEQAAARPPFRIDQGGVGGVALGSSAAAAERALGPGLREPAGGGLVRLRFPARESTVLLQPATGRVIGIVTWSALDTTGANVGPCSRAATVRAAYGNRLTAVAGGGGITALRLGRIVFAVGADGFVRAVLVADAARVPPLAALEAPACGQPSV